MKTLSPDRLLKITTTLVVVIAVINSFAVAYTWYWRIGWLDVVMHFLGGAWLGLLGLWVVYYAGWGVGHAVCRWLGWRAQGLAVVACVGALFFGLAWEVAEYVYDVAYIAVDGYVTDTIIDLIMDTLGALAAAYVVWRYGERPEGGAQIRESAVGNRAI